MEEKNKRKFKIMFIVMSAVLCCFFIVGVVQTFILKSKQINLNNLKTENLELEQEYNKTKDEYEYKSDENYQNEYWENEEGYGEEGDKIIEIN